MEKLTSKQKLFVKHYLCNGFNATQAALSAGYKEKFARHQGAENLAKPIIKKLIEEEMARTSEILDLKREDVVKMMLEDRKDAKSAFRANFQAAVKSTENIARICGFLSDKTEHSLTSDSENLVKFQIYMPENERDA